MIDIEIKDGIENMSKEERNLWDECRAQGYHWIARDIDGRLCVFESRPNLQDCIWDIKRKKFCDVPKEYYKFIKYTNSPIKLYVLP